MSEGWRHFGSPFRSGGRPFGVRAKRSGSKRERNVAWVRRSPAVVRDHCRVRLHDPRRHPQDRSKGWLDC